jgi:hypothetical protein
MPRLPTRRRPKSRPAVNKLQRPSYLNIHALVTCALLHLRPFPVLEFNKQVRCKLISTVLRRLSPSFSAVRFVSYKTDR